MKCISTFLCLVALATPGLTQVDLATAAAYGALAVSGITNTGPSVITGDIGTTGATITGFPPGLVSGTSETGTADVDQARADALNAYNVAQGLAGGIDSTADSELGGQTLVAGIYKYTSGVSLTGILTLDGAGNSDATWVFQISSTLITASASSVVLINGASACNIYWAVGSSATLGSTSAFVGNILASESISLTTGATLDGGGLYAGAAITLDDNVITLGDCSPTTTTSSSTVSSTTTSSLTSSVTPTTTTTTSATTTSTTSTPISTSTTISTTSTPTSTSTSKTSTTTSKSTSKVTSTTSCPTITTTSTHIVYTCTATPTTLSTSCITSTTTSLKPTSKSTSIYKPTTSSKGYGWKARAVATQCSTVTSTITSTVFSCTTSAKSTSTHSSTITVKPTTTSTKSTSTKSSVKTTSTQGYGWKPRGVMV